MPWGQLFNPVIGLKEGLTDPVCDLNMGETAEVLAKEGTISREKQDEFRARSHPEGGRGAGQAGPGDRPRAGAAAVRPGGDARQRGPREPVG